MLATAKNCCISKIGVAIVCFVFGCVLVSAPQAMADVVPFYTDNGPYGDLYRTSDNADLGTFIFNLFNPGDQYASGVNIFAPWNQPGSVVGFYVDFTGAFSYGVDTRHIVSVDFTNEKDLANPSDDCQWSSSFTGLTATFNSTPTCGGFVNGQWYNADIHFSEMTAGTLGFSGNFIVASDNPDGAAVPEPATLILFGSGLASLVARRRKIRGV